MKMAKANQHDLDMAMELMHALDALDDGCMPKEISQDDEWGERERFDINEREHCRRVVEYLLELNGKASLMRVVGGMVVLLDPANLIVDPNASVLEHHPEVLAGLRALQLRSDASPVPVAWLHPDDPSLAMSQVTKQRMLDGGSASAQAAQAFSQPAFSSEPSWRPIADAPRDGTEVWAFNGEQARMKWIEGEGYALWVWADPLLSDADPSPPQPSHFVPLLADPIVG